MKYRVVTTIPDYCEGCGEYTAEFTSRASAIQYAEKNAAEYPLATVELFERRRVSSADYAYGLKFFSVGTF